MDGGYRCQCASDCEKVLDAVEQRLLLLLRLRPRALPLVSSDCRLCSGLLAVPIPNPIPMPMPAPSCGDRECASGASGGEGLEASKSPPRARSSSEYDCALDGSEESEGAAADEKDDSGDPSLRLVSDEDERDTSMMVAREGATAARGYGWTSEAGGGAVA